MPEIIAIIIAFLVGAIILLATGYSPLEAYGAMIMFGNIFGIGQTLTRATPIILRGFGWRC